MSENLKTCPFCAEEIKEAAVVCKHCGRSLIAEERQKGSKNKVLKLVAFAIVAICISLFLFTQLANQKAKVEGNIIRGLSAPGEGSREVVYEIGGTAYDVHVTSLIGEGKYNREDIQVSREGGLQAEPLYFEYSLGAEDHAYLRVKNNQTGGSVACRITINGRVVSEESGTISVSCAEEQP